MVLNGIADRYQKAPGWKTPLLAALTPNLDRPADSGACGHMYPAEPGVCPASDIPHWKTPGYGSRPFCGRASLEEVGEAAELISDAVVFRVNLSLTASESGYRYVRPLYLIARNHRCGINPWISSLTDKPGYRRAGAEAMASGLHAASRRVAPASGSSPSLSTCNHSVSLNGFREERVPAAACVHRLLRPPRTASCSRPEVSSRCRPIPSPGRSVTGGSPSRCCKRRNGRPVSSRSRCSSGSG